MAIVDEEIERLLRKKVIKSLEDQGAVLAAEPIDALVAYEAGIFAEWIVREYCEADK